MQEETTFLTQMIVSIYIFWLCQSAILAVSLAILVLSEQSKLIIPLYEQFVRTLWI